MAKMVIAKTRVTKNINGDATNDACDELSHKSINSHQVGHRGLMEMYRLLCTKTTSNEAVLSISALQ